MAVRKVGLLLSLLPTRPLEFYDRVATSLEVRMERLWMRPPTHQPGDWEEVIRGLEAHLRVRMDEVFREPALTKIEGAVRQEIEEIRADAPFSLTHCADFALARLGYAVCRAIRPVVVLETGVAYGVTSAFILQALEVNGAGTLHSVDLPPLGRGADRFVGSLIPAALKARWRLHRGVSRRVLPELLSQLGRVEVFVHDSLHTYRNMRREFRMVAPYLAPRAAVIADDVDGNPAFVDWVERAEPAFWATVQEAEKPGCFGVGVFHR
jgi:hypothetical protein